MDFRKIDRLNNVGQRIRISSGRTLTLCAEQDGDTVTPAGRGKLSNTALLDCTATRSAAQQLQQQRFPPGWNTHSSFGPNSMTLHIPSLDDALHNV